MASYGPPAGFALRRNGTCLTDDNEIECSHNWGEWHVCCPENTYCSSGGTCCPTDSDCSARINNDPHCSNNGTWDLYEHNGYFCCLSGSTGFVATNLEYNGEPTEGVGCANDYPRGEYNTVLNVVAYGTAAETSSAMPSTTSTTSEPTTTTQTASGTNPSNNTQEGSDTSSSSNTEAIAGGVVGGVAGLALILALIWFMLRGRRRQRLSSGDPVRESTGIKAELDNSFVRAELDGDGDAVITYELPGNTPPR